MTSKYAIEFMNKSKNENKPFLCYVPFQVVHGPHVVKEELLKRVPAEIMSKKTIPKSAIFLSIHDAEKTHLYYYCFISNIFFA